MQNSIGSIYTNYQPFQITAGQELSFNFKIYNKIIGVFFPEVNFKSVTPLYVVECQTNKILN